MRCGGQEWEREEEIGGVTYDASGSAPTGEDPLSPAAIQINALSQHAGIRQCLRQLSRHRLLSRRRIAVSFAIIEALEDSSQ